MEITDAFLNNLPLNDEDNMESLLELAELLRTLIAAGQQDDMIRIIQYTVDKGFLEAFVWCMELLQEALENEDACIQSFECVIGSSVHHYDDLIERLQVNLHAPDNSVKTVFDKNGEVDSFFNILAYKTRYRNISFVSSENFDTKDNDSVEYKLIFTNGRMR